MWAVWAFLDSATYNSSALIRLEGHRASTRQQQFSKQAVKSKDAMTVLRHSRTHLHLGVTVLLRCITTQSSNILPKWNWASSSSVSNPVILTTCPEYIIHDASPSGRHILNSVHLSQINNVWDLNCILWVQRMQFDHLSWWYNPPIWNN